jgi:large subunit ribosomal protein L29
MREMNSEELDDKLVQLQNDLMKMRGVLASGGIPENVGRMRETRKTIARILTIKKIKETEKPETKQKTKKK